MSFHIHVGENDGEAPECSWAISNGVAASTREMGPGHRREKLDQHFGDFNWQKNVSQATISNAILGDTLLCKIKDTVPKATDHEDRFKHFTASLPQSDVVKWTEMVEAWEVDRNKPNPFAWTVASTTEAAMHLQLAQEDAQDEITELDGDALHTTSLKGMISQGIQLESSQWRISCLNKELGAHSTNLHPSITQLPEASQFNGKNLTSWRIKVTEIISGKGLWGYVDRSIPCPPTVQAMTGTAPTTTPLPPDATPLYSSTPSYDEWKFRDSHVHSHIILNIDEP
ncbi:hypothetical protein IW261DRAFT_1680454 [Armillaria novae-zelandiae]|uniref:Uncharacterized protein n=1 Tax=Armillaria novae-zelandiae TaxID=153914 RepID=A0AA39TZC9_9AGAR|nr:hypothetical protein IW261DRAFT_1680454 [Armillaria novae-zelandiae]